MANHFFASLSMELKQRLKTNFETTPGEASIERRDQKATWKLPHRIKQGKKEYYLFPSCNSLKQNPLFSFSDPEGGCLADPPVASEPEAGGSEEALPLGHDAPLQQQQGEQEDGAAGEAAAVPRWNSVVERWGIFFHTFLSHISLRRCPSGRSG